MLFIIFNLIVSILQEKANVIILKAIYIVHYVSLNLFLYFDFQSSR